MCGCGGGVYGNLGPRADSRPIIALEKDTGARCIGAHPDSNKTTRVIGRNIRTALRPCNRGVNDKVAPDSGAGFTKDAPGNAGAISIARACTGLRGPCEQKVSVRQLRDNGLILRAAGLLINKEICARAAICPINARKDALP